MRDDDFLQAHGLGGAHEREDLAASEMAGRENHVVLRDPLEAAARGFDEVARRIDDGKRRRGDAFGCELALNLRPKRKLRAATVQSSGGLVFGVDGRHPHDLATRSAGELDGNRVQPADAVIQRQRAKGFDAWDRLRHDLRAFAGLDVMRLQDEAAHPARKELPSAIDVVDAAGDDVGADMDLKVVRPFERIPRAIGHVHGCFGRRLWRHGSLDDQSLISSRRFYMEAGEAAGSRLPTGPRVNRRGRRGGSA